MNSPNRLTSYEASGGHYLAHQAIPEQEAFSTDCFITHDWGVDELGRRNHDRVSLINSSLAARGLRTWLDANAMTGNIIDQLAAGMSASRVVVVFLTKSYVDKVESNGFNVCQLEFNHAIRKKQSSLIAVAMEPRMRNIASSNGLVGMALSSVPLFDFSQDDNWDGKCDDLANIIRVGKWGGPSVTGSGIGGGGLMSDYSPMDRRMVVGESVPSYNRPSTAPAAARPPVNQTRYSSPSPAPSPNPHQFYNSGVGDYFGGIAQQQPAQPVVQQQAPVSFQQPSVGVAAAAAASSSSTRELASLSVTEVGTVLDNLKLSAFKAAFLSKQVDGETLFFVETVAELAEIGVDIPAKARLLHSKVVQFQSQGVPLDLLVAPASVAPASTTVSPSAGAAAAAVGGSGDGLKVGSQIEARFKGGRSWYGGIIVLVNKDNTVDVKYNDGDVESNVDRSMVRLKAAEVEDAESEVAITVGSKVEGNWKGKGKWYLGVLSRVRLNGHYDIDYDDGEKETNIEAKFVRLLAAPTSASTQLSEGGNKSQGRFLPGKIARPQPDGTYHGGYDDGEGESRAEKPTTTATTLRVNDRVEANFKGRGRWYPGRITRVRLNGSCHIAYDDGEEEDDVVESRIRKLESTKAHDEGEEDQVDIRIGSIVTTDAKSNGRHLPGKVTRARLNGTFDVQLDDGEMVLGVERGQIIVKSTPETPGRGAQSRFFEAKFKEGERVKGNYRGKGKWYTGKIARIRADGTYDVNYDDGETETRLKEELVHKLDEPDRTWEDRDGNLYEMHSSTPADSRLTDIAVGTRVEADYKGRGKYFPGKVARVRLNGTYDIDYDDGESELAVAVRFIRVASTLRITSAGANKIEEGSVVEGNYRGRGKWYPGKISRERPDGTFDINFDDGETELRVERDCIRLLGQPADADRAPADRSPAVKARLEEGSKVEANFRGRGKWYPGKISKERPDGTFDVAYDDGESELRVEASLIRLVDVPVASTSRAVKARLEEGSKVEANFKGRGKWYPGKISRERPDGTFDIAYDDGESELRVEASLIRLVDVPAVKARLEEGSKVEANFKGRGKWYPGKISRERPDGTFDVAYDDGESELRVEASLIRLLDAPVAKVEKARLEEGAKVEVKYKGKSIWYKGKISKERADGTFDIVYDDGESELRVDASLIHLVDVPVQRPRLQEGCRVEGNYKGKGKWYPGKITRERPDGTFDVDYDDGEFESRLRAVLIRFVAPPEAPEAKTTARLDEGSKVEVNFRGRGKWYPGKISRVRPDGSFDVQYDDGETEARVASENIRLLSSNSTAEVVVGLYKVNERVECNYRGRGKWYRGRISRVWPEDLYDINYDDGESESKISLECIRHLEKRAEMSLKLTHFEVDDVVDIIDESDRSQLLRGRIVKDRGNDTFDVQCTDKDEKKTRVSCDCMKLVNKAKKRAASSDDEEDAEVAQIFALQSKIEVNYKGKGKWFPGTIDKYCGNGKYVVLYEDGDSEHAVAQGNIRAIAVVPAPAPAPARAPAPASASVPAPAPAPSQPDNFVNHKPFSSPPKPSTVPAPATRPPSSDAKPAPSAAAPAPAHAPAPAPAPAPAAAAAEILSPQPQQVNAVKIIEVQRSVTPTTVSGTRVEVAPGMMSLHITKIEVFDLRGFDPEDGYDAYGLVTFSEKQMARTTTIYETKSSAIWSYNPGDINMRFLLDNNILLAGLSSMEVKIMNQNNLRPDELIGGAKGYLPVVLAAETKESGEDVEVPMMLVGSNGNFIGRLSITMHRHVYTDELSLQKDLKPNRKESKRPSLQINAKSERNLIAALVSEPQPQIQSLLAPEDIVFVVGDKVVVKKAPGSHGKDKMNGEVFARNKDGTYMVKLSDARVYNRVTADRISKTDSKPNSRRPSDVMSPLQGGPAINPFLNGSDISTESTPSVVVIEYRIGERVEAQRKDSAAWSYARVLSVSSNNDWVDVRFTDDGAEENRVSMNRVRKLPLGEAQ